MPIQLPLLLKTHRKMDDKDILNRFLQDFIQVKTDHVRLNITGFIDSFRALIVAAD